jgi:hypothetical protein
MEKISWIDRERREVLQRVKKETNIVQTIKIRKANSIGREDEKEDISYQMALMKREVTGN